MKLFSGVTLRILFVVAFLLTFATALPEWHLAKDGRQYLIESAPKYNWHEASHECTSRGLQLVEIGSAVKNTGFEALLRKLFKNAPDLWIGATDLTDGKTKGGKARAFYWALRKQRVTFTHWGKGQPDNSKGQEHCVHVYSKTDYKWNDANCKTTKIGYVCETRFVE